MFITIYPLHIINYISSVLEICSIFRSRSKVNRSVCTVDPGVPPERGAHLDRGVATPRLDRGVVK